MHSSKQTTARTALLRWTARLGAVTAEAVADRWQVTLGSARGRLAAAERKRLLVRRRPLVDEPALYTLTRAGRRAAGVPAGAPCRVSPANAMHLIACAHVAAALERCYCGYTAVGERELVRLSREGEGALVCARLGRDPSGVPMWHRPDLALLAPVDAAERPVAVEVELTVKSPRRLEEICRAWARCRDVGGVIYLTAPGVEPALERAIGRADASTKVVVVPLDALLSPS